jgi:ligand-binding sensor domain-containing protein
MLSARAGVAYLALSGVFAGHALALDPSRPVSSYLGSKFTMEDDGLPANIVNVVLQSPDGLFWIATSGGLARFDGRHFTTVQLSPERPTGPTRALA